MYSLGVGKFKFHNSQFLIRSCRRSFEIDVLGKRVDGPCCITYVLPLRVARRLESRRAAHSESGPILVGGSSSFGSPRSCRCSLAGSTIAGRGRWMRVDPHLCRKLPRRRLLGRWCSGGCHRKGPVSRHPTAAGDHRFQLRCAGRRPHPPENGPNHRHRCSSTGHRRSAATCHPSLGDRRSPACRCRRCLVCCPLRPDYPLSESARSLLPSRRCRFVGTCFDPHRPDRLDSRFGNRHGFRFDSRGASRGCSPFDSRDNRVGPTTRGGTNRHSRSQR